MAVPPSGGSNTRSLTSAEDAWALLAKACPTHARREMVSLGDALGRVLAGSLMASEDVPAHPRSMVDGFAVRAADLAKASATDPVRLQLVGRLGAGEMSSRQVAAGECLAVPTGGVVPDGSNAVVMVEDATVVDGSTVEVRADIALGRNVLARGADLAVGGVVLPAGRRLAPRDVAALALFGVSGVAVNGRPRVAVLSSGTELLPSDAERTDAQVRDVNQPALCAAAMAAGAVVTSAGIVPDDAATLAAQLSVLAVEHDLVILTGGSSVGSKDFAAEALRAAGATLLFHGLDVRPGRPMLAGRLGHSLVIGLPGVPAAAFILFQRFLRPLFPRLEGEHVPVAASSMMQARLASAVESRLGREDYLRVRLEVRPSAKTPGAPQETWAVPLAGGPSLLSTLFAADALAVVPPARARMEAGDLVELVSLR